MVFIHPTACSPKHLASIQLSTGLRAIVGRTYGYLVHPNGNPPQMRTTKPTHYSAFDRGPFGGNAA
jgi:hypothetical protein